MCEIIRIDTQDDNDVETNFQKASCTLEVGVKIYASRVDSDVPPDNEFEKRIRPEVIPANEIGVTFADIGALDEIKESLQELVMLPLRRPDLFKGGGLLKPCKGILLFGPPRIMVGLPFSQNREKILETLLSKEKVKGVDFKELATVIEGYHGSDLQEKKQRVEEEQNSEEASNTPDKKKDIEIFLRPLNIEDMKQAKNRVAASFAAEGSIMSEVEAVE
ncbi:hypothetical protein IFM89_031077 [Coptis chinensis]|uniref:Uncharacterized protein n=1 Tax=Coptis chinensis TaxID=261450 RepID=A0A835M1A7_9MAGN|nr:hypothetical protein IFM89_031077 [Coptis chinensis]